MENHQAPRPGVLAKLTDWNNEPSLQTLKGDLEAAKPAHDTQQQRIDNWVNQLQVKGKAKPPKTKNRSSIQPKLIRRQAEWRYSALTEPFLGMDKLFTVKPTTFEDTDSANQNEIVLNWQFRTKLNKVKFIDEYVRACVDEGTVIVRTGWKRNTKIIKKEVPVWDYFEMTDEAQAPILQAAIELKESNPRAYEENTPPEIKAAVEYYEENGEGTVAVQNGTTTVDHEIVLENRPELQIMNPANVYIDPSCEGDINKAMFVVYSFETNKYELSKEPKKYKQLDAVNWEGNTPLAEPDYQTKTPNDFGFKDPMRKKVVAYEYWGYFDINGDEKLVPFVATWIGDVMIRMELNPFPDEKLPFTLATYLPVKREAYGEPDAEMLEDNQAILGAVTRGMIDSLGRSANGQIGIAKGMLDVLQKRRFENGEDYEFNPTMNPVQGVIEHKFPELPQSAMVMLQLQNQEAEALSGVKSFSGGLSGDSYGKVATNTRGVLDAASKREMSILRRLTNGMVNIGNKIIAMNAEFLSEQEVIRVTNEKYIGPAKEDDFLTVNREDLKGNFDLIIDISTAESDNEQAQDLGFMLQTMGPNMDQMLVMKILAKIAKLKRMPDLAKQLESWKPTPDPMAEQMKQLQLEEQALKNEVLRTQAELNSAKAEFERSRKDLTDLDFVEQETGTKHARDMQKQEGQAKGNQKLEITKALTKSHKEGEKQPDIAAAIGYNKLSDKLDEPELVN